MKTSKKYHFILASLLLSLGVASAVFADQPVTLNSGLVVAVDPGFTFTLSNLSVTSADNNTTVASNLPSSINSGNSNQYVLPATNVPIPLGITFLSGYYGSGSVNVSYDITEASYHPVHVSGTLQFNSGNPPVQPIVSTNDQGTTCITGFNMTQTLSLSVYCTLFPAAHHKNL